jgi:tetratricopeptide (TPR) repeat protein
MLAMAHCAHFLSVAEAAAPHLTGPDQGRWLARLDADQANLRRATGYAAARPDGTALVLRFGAALRRYWITRSRHQEALGLLDPALDRPDARADPALFAAALAAAAHAASQCDHTAERQLGERAAEVARQLGDDRLLIESLTALCLAHYFTGKPDTALPLGQEAVQRARQLGDDVLLGRSLMAYLLPMSSLDPARCERLYREAIGCTERSGDRYVNYTLHDNAGWQALDAGDISAARAHLEQAAQVAQAIGQTSHHLPVNLGWVLRQEGDPDGARSKFEEGLRLARRSGDRSGLAYASDGLACLATDLGDWHRAAELHGAAQAFLDRTAEQWEQAEARYRSESLGHLRARLGDQQFQRAYAQGMALSLEDAIDLASRKTQPP